MTLHPGDGASVPFERVDVSAAHFGFKHPARSLPRHLARRVARGIVRWRPGSHGTWLDLLRGDDMERVIGTVTIYEGEAPVPRLREKVEELVAANPWLAGRLQTAPDTGATRLWIPDDPDPSAAFLELRPPSPCSPVVAALPHMVRGGTYCLDRDLPLFRVVLVQHRPGRFALIVSLCHALGDGHTYYRLYGGLGPETRCPALDPQRRPTPYFTALLETLGPARAGWLASRSYRWSRVINAFAKPRPHTSCWTLDADWIASEKRRFEGGDASAPWVSTNDVVTSWFLGGRGDGGLIAVNLRNRYPELRDDHAGNYVAALPIRGAQCSTPATVRAALTEVGRSHSSGSDVPGLATTLRDRRGVVTNWARLYSPLRIPDCTQVVHFPLARSDEPRLSELHEALVLFRPRPELLGAVLVERGSPRRRGHPILARQIW